MKKQVLLISFLTVLLGQVLAQQTFQYKNIDVKNKANTDRNKFDLGLGLGIEYSGFLGAQIEYAPISRLGIFASGGFFLVGAGWDVGAKVYIMPKITSKTFRVYATGMYGTNTAIMIIDASEYNKIYLGPTFGAGVEMRFGKQKVNGLNVALLYPVRSQEYKNDIDALNRNPYIESIDEPLPVGISVGYHREF
jgi:hypothetical protein